MSIYLRMKGYGKLTDGDSFYAAVGKLSSLPVETFG